MELVSSDTTLCFSTPHIFHPAHRPADGCRTRSEWLLESRCRVRRGARPVAVLHQVLDRPLPHCRRFADLPTDEIDRLRLQLLKARPGVVPNGRLFAAARAAGHVLQQHLFAPADAVVIDRLTQAEAAEVLSRRLWLPGSCLDQHIIAKAVRGRELRTTTVTRPGRPVLTAHRNGREHQGVRAGTGSRMIDFDADRHAGAVPLEEHIRRVQELLRVLQDRYQGMMPHVGNINPGNASCHVVCYTSEVWSVAKIAKWIADLRSEFWWLREWKVYPVDLPQVYLPLRSDKATVIDVSLARHQHRRKVDGNIKRVDGHNWVGYLSWLESDRPCDPDAVEGLLRRATTPDRLAKENHGSGAISNGE